MKRILLKPNIQKNFLEQAKKVSGLNFKQLGEICGVNAKNISDWHIEKSTISYKAAKILEKKFSLRLPSDYEILPDFWHVRKAGKLGGLKRIEKYGNPGTEKGRKLGGTKSIISNKKLNNNFKFRKVVNTPPLDYVTAEIFGIIIGDGGINYHQVTISLNCHTDKEYAKWVKNKFEKIFKIKVSDKVRDSENVLQIVASGVNLVEFLIANGLSRGNKIRNQIDIPKWIKEDQKLEIACIRGLVDTDGCIYFDKHKYKNKIYKNICLDFTSASPKLLNSAYNIITDLGLEPRMYAKSIKIRKLENVKQYFKIIGSHNQKHLNKFNSFINGEVA